MKDKANCRYYLDNKDNDNNIFTLNRVPYCANIKCKNIIGKVMQKDAEGSWFGECSTKGYIENGIPVDERGKVVDLEESVEEAEFRKSHEGIKPLDLKVDSFKK